MCDGCCYYYSLLLVLLPTTNAATATTHAATTTTATAATGAAAIPRLLLLPRQLLQLLLMMVQVIKRLMHLDGSGSSAPAATGDNADSKLRASSLAFTRSGALEDAQHIPDTHAEELERFERALAQGNGGSKMRGISVSGKVSGAENRQPQHGAYSQSMDLSNFQDLAPSMCWFGDIGRRKGQRNSAAENFCCGSLNKHVFVKRISSFMRSACSEKKCSASTLSFCILFDT